MFYNNPFIIYDESTQMFIKNNLRLLVCKKNLNINMNKQAKKM